MCTPRSRLTKPKRWARTLTPVGAEKAGNKDGTIPEYKGGNTTPPAAFKAGDGIRPDPFAGEKPRLTIDAKNMAQHADKLTEGTKALLQKYPTFRVDVYPTHRTVAFPKFVTDNTLKNATKAKTTNEGRSIEGAHAGFPFPIPKTGYEAMWNHLVRFNGQAYEAKYRNLTVDANGRPTLSTEGNSVQEYPFWDNSKTSADTYWRIKLDLHRTGAPRRRSAADRRSARHGHQGPPCVELSAGPAAREGRAGFRARHAATRVPPAPPRSTTRSSSSARWNGSTSSWSARRRCSFRTTPIRRCTNRSRTIC